jgi:hypothetical protein
VIVMKTVVRVVLSVLFLSAGIASAESVPFDSERWSFAGEHRLEEHLGRPALFLKNAKAVLEGIDMSSGAIEFDIAFTPDRGFSGAMFHFRDGANFEQFYLRPHQSGNPDASQYQPVINGNAAWQIYYGEQWAAPVVHRFDVWQHVRIEFLQDRAAVYVDSDAPVLIIGSLDRRDPGGAIGVQSGFAPVHFSNFQYESGGEFKIERPSIPAREGMDREVHTWEVSTAFNEELAQVDSLDEFKGGELTWSRLTVESNGIANIARTVNGRQPNTVFARITIEATEAVRRAFEFGFSDRARVFVNGRAVYAGSRKYESQDYRYLGTIGLHDSLLLDLKAGRNEITLAVSEDFGGWGVIGRFVNADGLRWDEAGH